MENNEFMNEALRLAKEAADEGEVPVGAVVTIGNKIIGKGRNRREKGKNALCHAEIEAINEACKRLGGWRLWECELYVTLEPCPMCAGAIINSRIKKVVFGAYDKKNGASRINWSNFTDDCCKIAFLKCAFLTCGTVNDPNKNYHLEFVVPYMNLSKDLNLFISDYPDLSVIPKSITRNSNYVIYFKDSESIEDLLTVMGAFNSSLEIMGVKMYKDVRNNVNRKLNFENANLDKTISAASKQTNAILHIKDTVGLSYLSDDLRELAELRIENPDMSLRELGNNLTNPISRSGVNHRLQKLCEIAAEIKK